MRYRHILPLAVVLILAAVACARVDGTGRRQFAIMPDSEMNAQGAAAYTEVKQKEKPSTDPAANAFVVQVGTRLAAAQPTVTADRHFQYEFTVLQSKQINAFCLPGGKVAVYTAILSYCQNEAGLATVLGHEIAHATSNHGNERVSQSMIAGISQSALGIGLQASGLEANTQNLLLGAAGGLAQYGVLLPYSRAQESEADFIGLKYMAAAGYDPQEAVGFWQRFSALGGSTPAFMSTHPASGDRAAALAREMPEALAIYAKVAEKHGAGALVPEAYRSK